MHRNLHGVSSRKSWGGSWGLDVLAALLLSFGVGAATAAFTVMNRVDAHTMPFSACETMLEMPIGPSAYVTYTSASLLPVDAQPLAPILAAGALAILVACARGAGRLLDAPGRRGVIVATSIGALVLVAALSSVSGIPAPGIRGIAFAISVAMLATRFARASREELLPARA
jgi:hypothetical protein